jgi:hypothetical protein
MIQKMNQFVILIAMVVVAMAIHSCIYSSLNQMYWIFLRRDGNFASRWMQRNAGVVHEHYRGGKLQNCNSFPVARIPVEGGSR